MPAQLPAAIGKREPGRGLTSAPPVTARPGNPGSAPRPASRHRPAGRCRRRRQAQAPPRWRPSYLDGDPPARPGGQRPRCALPPAPVRAPGRATPFQSARREERDARGRRLPPIARPLRRFLPQREQRPRAGGERGFRFCPAAPRPPLQGEKQVFKSLGMNKRQKTKQTRKQNPTNNVIYAENLPERAGLGEGADIPSPKQENVEYKNSVLLSTSECGDEGQRC